MGEPTREFHQPMKPAAFYLSTHRFVCNQMSNPSETQPDTVPKRPVGTLKYSERTSDMFTNVQMTKMEQLEIEKLFNRVFGQGMRGQLFAKLTGRQHTLKTLSRYSQVATRRTAGTVIVPLQKIVGSEGRGEDFDANFHPLKPYNRKRWIGIAAARWMGAPLPPVELFQVGEVYYVRDGHHRISVARAMGELTIEARIVN
jgi:hypothetical protein